MSEQIRCIKDCLFNFWFEYKIKFDGSESARLSSSCDILRPFFQLLCFTTMDNIYPLNKINFARFFLENIIIFRFDG